MILAPVERTKGHERWLEEAKMALLSVPSSGLSGRRRHQKVATSLVAATTPLQKSEQLLGGGGLVENTFISTKKLV